MDMDESLFERIADLASYLKLDIDSQELALLSEKEQLSQSQMEAILKLMQHLSDKKHETVIDTLLRMSRLPVKSPKTFENYDFSRIHGKDTESLKNLSLLTELYAGKNIALIGPTGVGKTHLAEAYGRACCNKGFKTYFLKASELNEKFTNARKADRTARAIASLVKPSCLIIDEIGKTTFDKENTLLFFDMVDRRYEKDGPNTMIFTSNKQPSGWSEYFTGKDDLLCALDRIFDNARVFMIKGPSYRGRKCETLAVEVNSDVTK